MTASEIMTIQRALGIIEGASYGVDNATANALIDAVQIIDEIVGREANE